MRAGPGHGPGPEASLGIAAAVVEPRPVELGLDGGERAGRAAGDQSELALDRHDEALAARPQHDGAHLAVVGFDTRRAGPGRPGVHETARDVDVQQLSGAVVPDRGLPELVAAVSAMRMSGLTNAS